MIYWLISIILFVFKTVLKIRRYALLINEHREGVQQPRRFINNYNNYNNHRPIRLFNNFIDTNNFNFNNGFDRGFNIGFNPNIQDINQIINPIMNNRADFFVPNNFDLTNLNTILEGIHSSNHNHNHNHNYNHNNINQNTINSDFNNSI